MGWPRAFVIAMFIVGATVCGVTHADVLGGSLAAAAATLAIPMYRNGNHNGGGK
jgi:hypothetical protein